MTKKRALERHGFAVYGKSLTYSVWKRMRSRCNNPNNHAYKDYGGRGISVCERWTKFSAFLADMGEPPAGLTIDRIDNERGYSPDNCRWATKTQQSQNRRSAWNITFNGETHCRREWERRLGFTQGLIFSRIRDRGWSVEKALSTPPLREWPLSGTAKANALKTHCARGHPYDEANTYRTGGKWRACRTCGRLAQAAYQKRKAVHV